MSIDPISARLAQGSNRMIPHIGGRPGQPLSEVLRKNLGEPLPRLADISKSLFLQSLFGQQGAVERIRRKLASLTRRKGKIIPAKGITASAANASKETNFEDLVFVGTEFLEEFHPQEDLLAGILAHEWGHLISEFPNGPSRIDAEQLTWDQIYELRRDEEAAADGFSGKMLYQMGYSPEGVVRFLMLPRNRQESLKYHPVETRAAIIRHGFSEAKRKEEQARKLATMLRSAYPNPLFSKLLAVG